MKCWTDTIEGLTAKAEKSINRNPEDYISDGLLYCGCCGTPKQIRVNFCGHEYKPMVMCRCEQEKRKAEEEEKKRKENEYRIKCIRDAAFSEKCMQTWTFENDDGKRSDIRSIMQNYVEHFSELKQMGKGLLLYGSIGSGKTYAACEVANALIDKGIPCLVTNFATLVNRLQDSFHGRQELLDSLSNYALLVIDDLGAERNTEYMQETVFSVIDTRYRSGLPMIITTNLQMKDFKDPGSIINARIYDRILERCHPVEIGGPSRRRDTVRNDYNYVQSLLVK